MPSFYYQNNTTTADIEAIDLIEEAWDLSGDSRRLNWSYKELFSYLTAGQIELCNLKPDALVENKSMTFASSTRQVFPVGAMQLIGNFRNANPSDTSAITKVDRNLMDAYSPTWTDETATLSAKHYMIDDRDPGSCLIYPKNTGSGIATADFSVLPKPASIPVISGTFQLKATISDVERHPAAAIVSSGAGSNASLYLITCKLTLEDDLAGILSKKITATAPMASGSTYVSCGSIFLHDLMFTIATMNNTDATKSYAPCRIPDGKYPLILMTETYLEGDSATFYTVTGNYTASTSSAPAYLQFDFLVDEGDLKTQLDSLSGDIATVVFISGKVAGTLGVRKEYKEALVKYLLSRMHLKKEVNTYDPQLSETYNRQFRELLGIREQVQTESDQYNRIPNRPETGKVQ